MIALTILSLILQSQIPTPESYTAIVLGVVWSVVSGILIWSLNRNVNNQDEEIDSLKETIKESERKKEEDRKEYLAMISKINDNMDRLKDNAASNAADINNKLSVLAIQITNDLKELAVKVASVANFNDKPSK